jgi:hypothetical protein
MDLFWVWVAVFTFAGYWAFIAGGEAIEKRHPEGVEVFTFTALYLSVWLVRLLWLGFAVKMLLVLLAGAR